MSVPSIKTDHGKEKRWFPLESNPTLLNSYVAKLGFNTETGGTEMSGGAYDFVDVLGTEPWAVRMVPTPVAAVVALFPMDNERVCERRRELFEEADRREKKVDARTDGDGDGDGDEGVWYVKQRISNACGTIAILHALGNTPRSVREASVRPSSWLHRFLTSHPAAPGDDGTAQADALESDAEIESFHEGAANDPCGQTRRTGDGERIDMHFVCFVHRLGGLYELDGRADGGPVRHGDATSGDLLGDACGVIRSWMEADPDEMRFTILALAPKRRSDDA